MVAVLLYGIGILVFGILFLYFAKMFINTSDTFIDFTRKNINYIVKLKFYNDFRVNAVLAAICILMVTQEILTPVSMVAFIFFIYRTAMTLSDKHIKEIYDLKKKNLNKDQEKDK